MKFKQIGKRMGKRFCAMVMVLNMVFSGFAGDGQVVFANPNQETDVQEQESTVIDVQTEDPCLIADEQDSGVYYNSSSQMRDFRDETIYFVMTTRFYDGDPSNNVQCWDGKSKNGESDPPWRGDFKGLIEKLDYIKALGFTAIWITPVVKNASGYDYHGYHAINFKEVDPRYESEGCTYQDLIDAAHAKGMKVIQDVVFNHTGNWGEENLYPMFTKDDNADLADVSCMKRNMDMEWASDYDTHTPENERGTYQLRDRLKLMNADNEQPKKFDVNDIYHHNGFVGSSFEQPIVQYGSIHYADCMDLNTENPKVYNYLVDAYSQYIRMGVDAFRVDTTKHISRLTFNNVFNTRLNDVYNEVHGTTGEGNFYMFGEVCTRFRNVWNDNKPAISTPFYTWKETKDYAWDNSETAAAVETNCASAREHYTDNANNVSEQPTSKNAYLEGNEYHKPDYSRASGLNVIDFPMHWAFKKAGDAYQQALAEDPYYNDSTFNVTYVDSHDYGPDGIEKVRYNGSTADWAENLSLIFTFRGIPCIYYGSEVEFQKGAIIDEGPNIALANSGRAYFGDYIEGSVDVVDFGRYTNATGAMAKTLNNDLSLHIQRLNRLRAAIPALRKGQYSTDGCNGSFAYKRRYTDDTTDSFAVVALSSDASFTGLPNGKYTDAITGDVKNVTDGTLKTSGIKGQGDLRVYVLDTEKTKAPGMIDGKSPYMSGGGPLNITLPTSVSLDKTSANLDLDETVTFTATVQPAEAPQNVAWTSSNDAVATVSGGRVTGKSEGTATITATTANGKTASATVTVKASGITVDAIELNKTAETLEEEQTLQLTATFTPANADEKNKALTWSSSDATVASVSQTGLVTAVKKGTATITATTRNGKTASAVITVKASGIEVESVELNKTSATLNAGDTLLLTATITPANANPKYAALTWKSSDAKVASVDSTGLVTAVKKGTATITATTASGESASMTVTVNGAVVYGNAIHFEKPSGWGSNINVYMWDSASWKNAAWPGVAMKDMGDGVYSLEWPEGKESASLNVIFNDGKNQTADLTATLNGYYNQSGLVKTVPPVDRPIQVTTAISLADPGATYTYNGQEQKPAVVVKADGRALTENTDYTVTYQNNVNAAAKTAGANAPSIIIKGKGDYATNIDDIILFTIAPKTLTDSNVTIADGTNVYTGAEIRPNVTVSDASATITANDYFVVYSDNTNAGTATVTVTGTGNYTGTVRKTFTIAKAGTPANPPTDRVVPADTKLSEISLGTNWNWSEMDKDKSVGSEQKLTVTAVYTGADKANYTNTSVTLVVTGSKGDCTHSVGTELVGQKSATCTENGYTGDKKCKKCGAVLVTGETIPAGHKWDEGKVTKEPTETAEGIKLFTCTVCKETKTESIAKLSHTIHVWDNGVIAKEATETEEGERIYHCTICDATKTEVIPKLTHQHTWDKGTITKEATETEEGEKTYKCTGCEETMTESIPKKTSTQCQHEWDDGEVTREATEKQSGEKTFTCTKCGTKKTQSIPVLPCTHQWTTGHIIKESTETEEGELEKTCPVCDATMIIKLPKKPCEHKNGWGEGVITKQPTETEEGVRTYTCEICKETKTEPIPATGKKPENPGGETPDAPGQQTPGTPGQQTPGTPGQQTPGTPGQQTPGQQTPGTPGQQTPGTPGQQTPEKTPGVIDTQGITVKKGDIVKDEVAKAVYRITNASRSAKTVEYMIAGSKEKKITVPDKILINNVEYKVTAVAEGAFKNKKTVEKVVLGANVKTVSAKAFSGCKNLKSVSVNGNLISIGKQAFYKCTGLTKIRIPAKVKSIGKQAFYGCKNLKSISIQTTKLTDKNVGSNAFKGISSKATIKVPKKKLSQYKILLKKKGVSKKVKIKK